MGLREYKQKQAQYNGLVREYHSMEAEIHQLSQKREWKALDRKKDQIEKNLSKYNQTDSDIEAIYAVKLDMENDIRELADQMALEFSRLSHKEKVDIMNGNQLERDAEGASQVLDHANVSAMVDPGHVVPMERNEKTFQRGNEFALKYKKTAEVSLEGNGDNLFLNCHLDGQQIPNSNDCWAHSISLLFKAKGIHISVDEIKKYRPQVDDINVNSTVLERINRDIPRGEVLSVVEMQQIFTDIFKNENMNISVENEFIPIEKKRLRNNNSDDNYIIYSQDLSDRSLAAVNEEVVAINKNVAKHLKGCIRKALEKGSPVSMIFNKHYTTIIGMHPDLNDDTIFDVEDSNMQGTQHLTLKEFMDRAVQTNSSQFELVWLKK